MCCKTLPPFTVLSGARAYVDFWNMEMIRVPDMLAQMNEWERTGVHVPFSIEFVTCDLKKGTGGEKIKLDEAVLVGSADSKSALRNPNHYNNYTRNIRSKDGDRIMKVHVLLITKFNGKSIIL